MAYLLGVAHEVREVLSSLGITHLHKLIGRTELLEQVVHGAEAGFPGARSAAVPAPRRPAPLAPRRA